MSLSVNTTLSQLISHKQYQKIVRRISKEAEKEVLKEHDLKKMSQIPPEESKNIHKEIEDRSIYYFDLFKVNFIKEVNKENSSEKNT